MEANLSMQDALIAAVRKPAEGLQGDPKQKQKARLAVSVRRAHAGPAAYTRLRAFALLPTPGRAENRVGREVTLTNGIAREGEMRRGRRWLWGELQRRACEFLLPRGSPEAEPPINWLGKWGAC